MSTEGLPADAGEVYRRYLSAVLLHGIASGRACGLGASDLYALNLLDLEGAMSPGELGARTGLTTGPTTRLIDRLEAAGYVRRVPSPQDRRKVMVEPSGEAVDLQAAVGPARRRVAEIIQGYSPDQLAVLFDYLRRATTAYEEAVDELRETTATAKS